LNQDGFRKLISGRSGGLGAGLLRFFLGIAAAGYSIVVWLRNFLYSRGWLKTCRANAVVISIGNITVGGTGKTPLVIWLCDLLRKKDISCGVLSRGYKTTKGNFSDEPAIFAESCPDAKVIVNPDRVAGATEAVEKFGAAVLIMDDGFQHRRLGREVDIVTIDATLPFGYGRMLPAGLLREPVASLKRADAAIITRCDQVSDAELARLEEKLRQVNPEMIIVRSVHVPTCAKSVSGEEIGIDELKGKKIFAFCGIGNPDAFLNTLGKLGANPVGSKIYNDHHQYTNNDIADIYAEAGHFQADLILSTQKDRTKINLLGSVKKDIPFAYLAIELKFLSGEDKFTQLIEDALAVNIVSRGL